MELKELLELKKLLKEYLNCDSRGINDEAVFEMLDDINRIISNF